MTRPPEGFADRLRQATAPDHEQAESSSFMDGLLAAEVNLAAYHLLTRQHLELYRALETSASALRSHPMVAALHDPALERVPALLADLAWLRRERGVEATLDAAPWDAGEQQRIVAEVSQAYAHNRAVLAALEQRARATPVDTEASVRHRGRRREPAPGLVDEDTGC